MIDDNEAWDAVQRRDRQFDGRFVTGVLSTGIYCRPSCAARHPARENVRFFADGAAARAQGLRACKRCLPDDVARDEAAITQAIGLLGREEPPRLAELAGAVGYSPAHFQRVFTRATGMSPSQFVRQRRANRAIAALKNGASVTEAIYEGGFSGPSRFYDTVKGELGMIPSAWKKGGAGETIHWHVADTGLGPMMIAATDKGICRLSFDEDERDLARHFPNATLLPAEGAALALAIRAAEAVADPAKTNSLPLDIGGTAFQRRVWEALCAIPAGTTRSYADIAREVGAPAATRAVGSACGANNVAILIPCHRVLRTNGELGGYAYGLERKRKLLAMEERGDDTEGFVRGAARARPSAGAG